VIRPARRAAREVAHVARGTTYTHRRARERLIALGVFSLSFDAVASVIALMVEADEPGSDIHSYGTALFWTTTQLLTVSSQMHNPVTTPGRILDVFLELYAIAIVASLAGIFGSFLYRRAEEGRPEEEQAGS
jgi:hypothetical protein